MIVTEENRLNREKNFIENAKKKHKNKYDYSKVHYVNLKTKVEIICPIHGSFFIRPDGHLTNSGCIECGKLNRLNRCNELKLQNKGPWSKQAREKSVETNIKRYGSKTWAESDVGRKFLIERCSSDEERQRMSERAKSLVAKQHYKETSLKRYGATHWAKSDIGHKILKEILNEKDFRKKQNECMRSKPVRKKTENTCKERYGTAYYWQSPQGRERLKCLLNREDVIAKREKTNLKLYGHKTWQGSDIGRKTLSEISLREDVQIKRDKTKRKNGTINSSKSEKIAYQMLIEKFGENNVTPQYKDNKRYPYYCDFYVEPIDTFIELNLFWIHGTHWFDPQNKDDLEKLEKWKSKQKDSYRRAVYVWTKVDLEKRQCALDNNLNYKVFWDNDLNDFKNWIDNQ